MNKKSHKKGFFLLAILWLAGFGMNAQTAWEFKDAATGTTIWDTAGNMTLTTQKFNSVLYTTTGVGAYPLLSTTTANVNAGLADFTQVNTPQSRRLIAITLRVSAGGPTYLRVSHPKTVSGNWVANQAITAGDANFKHTM